MSNRLWQWISLAFVVTIVYVLVRPSSNAAQFVQGVGKFARQLVTVVTDSAK